VTKVDRLDLNDQLMSMMMMMKLKYSKQLVGVVVVFSFSFLNKFSIVFSIDRIDSKVNAVV